MEGLLYSLLSNRQATFVNMVIGALLFIALLLLFFRKSSRDERGRKIWCGIKKVDSVPFPPK